MRNLRGTYVHHGDAARRRRRIKQALIVAAVVAAAGVVVVSRKPPTANAEPVRSRFFALVDSRKLWQDLETTRGELSLIKAQFDRSQTILQLSTRYDVSARLASSIFEASLKEGIDPELAFRLVNLESQFNDRAVSSVGAIGLTQLMPGTAIQIEKGATREKLFDRETNLRIGFRYLRGLLDMYHGNVRLALLAYNRGEDAVWRDLRNGVNPGEGYKYDRVLTKGYKGKGTIE